MKTKIKGINYKTKPAFEEGSCTGCAGMATSDNKSPPDGLCKTLFVLGCENLRWVEYKKEPKPTVEVQGITYKAIREHKNGLCAGCVAEKDGHLCNRITAAMPGGEHCYEKQIVWVEKKAPTKTVRWLNVYYNDLCSGALFHSEEAANAGAIANAERLACVRVEY